MNQLLPTICSRLAFLAALTVLLGLATAAAGQVDGVSVFAETTCDGHEVDVHITINVYDVVTPGITGWVVERDVVGNCIETVDVGEVQIMPTDIGEHVFVVHDVLTVPGKAIYYIKGIDEAGSRYWVYWPRRTHFAQADCFQGLAARGTVVEGPGPGHYLEVCPDECWWGLSYFDPIFPMNQEQPPIGLVVDIFGELVAGMEGPYIDADLWVPSSTGCTVVATDDLNWGSLKARYR